LLEIVIRRCANCTSAKGEGLLLPVLVQNFHARLAEPGSVLLQASQHDLVALIHMGAAKPRDIARAGIMLLLLLG
jgi:hypothetical protein